VLGALHVYMDFFVVTFLILELVRCCNKEEDELEKERDAEEEEKRHKKQLAKEKAAEDRENGVTPDEKFVGDVIDVAAKNKETTAKVIVAGGKAASAGAKAAARG